MQLKLKDSATLLYTVICPFQMHTTVAHARLNNDAKSIAIFPPKRDLFPPVRIHLFAQGRFDRFPIPLIMSAGDFNHILFFNASH